MAEVNSSAKIVRFGVFEADLQTGELRKNGVEVPLQDQPFQVCAILLENSGKLVTREELRRRVWPEDTFVDFDHALNTAITKIRVALGDEADNPRFVETMPRRGYRFIVPVNVPSSKAPTPGGPAIEAAQEEAVKPSSFRRWMPIAFLSVAAIAALLWALWRHPSRSTEVIERKLTANSLENGVKSAAVSPDGKFLAYSDNTGLYLKEIHTGETHRVTLPQNFSTEVNDWFPDGSHLLVHHEEQPGKQSLWSVSIFGGSPRLLTDDGSLGAISPDGTRIAFHRGGFGQEEWVMRSDGTDQVKVAAAKPSWVGGPTWSPDGNRIAYIRDTETYNARVTAVEVNDWRRGSAQTFFSDNRLGPSLHWLPDGRLVYVMGDDIDHHGASIWTIPFPPSGKPAEPPKRVTRGVGWIWQLGASHDSKVLTFLRENSVSSAYLADLAPDGTQLLAHRRLTLDENENEPFAWTPDGKAVLFSSDRTGTSAIFKQASDQPLAESLTTSAEQLKQPRVTPDGSEILYISTLKSASLETPSSLFAIPIGGGVPRLVLKDVGIWNVQCANSPLNFCLYSVPKGDDMETFRLDVKNGKSSYPSQVDPVCNWSLSPDGSQRALVCPSLKETIRLRSTLTGKMRDVRVTGRNELDSITWAADGKSFLVAGKTPEGVSALLRITLDGKASVLLRSTTTEILGAIPSPDGRSLALAEKSVYNNVWQIENF
jgi:Tol biopolymer transport system component/DNA-binding winged helix-turn-helix (wHTH) protein